MYGKYGVNYSEKDEVSIVWKLHFEIEIEFKKNFNTIFLLLYTISIWFFYLISFLFCKKKKKNQWQRARAETLMTWKTVWLEENDWRVVAIANWNPIYTPSNSPFHLLNSIAARIYIPCISHYSSSFIYYLSSRVGGSTAPIVGWIQIIDSRALSCESYV